MHERSRIRRSAEQVLLLYQDIERANNRKWWRWATCWFNSCTWTIGSYRLSRACYLLLGDLHAVLRLTLAPLLLLLRPWTGGHGIHYSAEIGGGMKILHPELGIV